jgi:hypothetical protein
MAQPVQTPIPSRVIYAVPHLIAACVITAIALALTAADLLAPAQLIPPQIQNLLIAVPIVAWCTYRSRCAQERILARLDEIEEQHGEIKDQLAERLASAGEAEAYVNGLMDRKAADREQPLRVVQ